MRLKNLLPPEVFNWKVQKWKITIPYLNSHEKVEPPEAPTHKYLWLRHCSRFFLERKLFHSGYYANELIFHYQRQSESLSRITHLWAVFLLYRTELFFFEICAQPLLCLGYLYLIYAPRLHEKCLAYKPFTGLQFWESILFCQHKFKYLVWGS